MRRARIRPARALWFHLVDVGAAHSPAPAVHDLQVEAEPEQGVSAEPDGAGEHGPVIP